jgi:branched-chain amino acid transport system permease protein
MSTRTSPESRTDDGSPGLLSRLAGRNRVMRGRPGLRTNYGADQAIFDTPMKRWLFLGLLVFAAIMPFRLGGEWLQLWALVFAAGIGAIGMNLISGYAGQISLGHAFFLGLGAYTAIVVSSPTGERLLGFGIDNVLIWIPLAGLVAAIVGAIVAPLATRLRGLYLAIVTLGLVILGEHIFREARTITGGVGTGRRGPQATLFGFDFRASGEVLGVMVPRGVRLYFLTFICLLILGVLAKNLVRSAAGRAFASVRDRDIAAEIMGVNLTYTKTLAFAISSFYAGVAGALVATVIGFTDPSGYNLLLSIQYIVMILIGGVATIVGSLIGAAFIVLLPKLVEEVAHFIPFISLSPTGAWPTAFQVERMLYGFFLIVFVLAEPRGMYGIWLRVRNYFKAWPFSY